jgi:hypothetical protein
MPGATLAGRHVTLLLDGPRGSAQELLLAREGLPIYAVPHCTVPDRIDTFDAWIGESR